MIYEWVYTLSPISSWMHCRHSNKAWINLVFSEMTQEITPRFDHLLCSIPQFPLCQSSVEMIGEKWIPFLIPGLSECNASGNGNDYHLDLWLIFCCAELGKDIHTISQAENTTVGLKFYWNPLYICMIYIMQQWSK